jgi:hypothetical protein
VELVNIFFQGGDERLLYGSLDQEIVRGDTSLAAVPKFSP